MIQFRDGPAAGEALSLRAAPLLLRVVIDRKGNIDALDQVGDRPRKNEKISVYIRCGAPFVGFIDYHDGRGRKGEPFVNAEYRLLKHPPSDGVMRDEDYWRAFSEGFAQEAATT